MDKLKIRNKAKTENEYVQFEIIDGILIGTYKVKSITMEIAINVVSLRKEFTDNEKYPALVKDYTTIKIEKKAREYFASDAGIEGISSVAVLTDSIYKSTLMNFFMKVLPPKMPVRLFNNEKDALYWLEENKRKKL